MLTPVRSLLVHWNKEYDNYHEIPFAKYLANLETKKCDQLEIVQLILNHSSSKTPMVAQKIGL